MTKGENFMKKGKCKHIHCSSMSNSACCDLNSKGDILKLHDKCPNPKCNCQKLIPFTPRQYMIEGGSVKTKLQSNNEYTEKAWSEFLKPAFNIASPYIGVAVSAIKKNPKTGQATTNILKIISGGKILSLTDLHGNGLRLKVTWSFQIIFVY